MVLPDPPASAGSADFDLHFSFLRRKSLQPAKELTVRFWGVSSELSSSDLFTLRVGGTTAEKNISLIKSVTYPYTNENARKLHN
jgi:hypothetical protein